MPPPATKPAIEDAAARLLALGVGREGSGWVIVRSGALGAYVASRQRRGEWVDAYWAPADAPAKIVDVTGAFFFPLTRRRRARASSLSHRARRCWEQLSWRVGRWHGAHGRGRVQM